MRGGFGDKLGALLQKETIVKRSLFDPVAVADLLERDRRGAIDASYSLLAVACVEIWCQKFADAPIPCADSIHRRHDTQQDQIALSS